MSGAAAERGASVPVPDVQAFPGHVACDANSRSELVTPVIQSRRVIPVIDLNSPVVGRFDAIDQAGIKRIAGIYVAAQG